MRRLAFLGLAACCALGAGACGQQAAAPGSGNRALPDTAGPYLGASGVNVLPVRVGAGSVCGQPGYENEPCTSVTVCVPGTSQCRTITDVLVDTGSVGFRVFSSALGGLALPPVADRSGHTLAECAQFGTGTDWGSVATADVVLGGEPPVTTPVQVIDRGFSSPPTVCANADPGPQQAGFNGVLGVGLFAQDCGQGCTGRVAHKVYFACPTPGPSPAAGSPSPCSLVSVTLAQQLQNPVALLPTDNNGVLLALPAVDTGGAREISGVLILGIATRDNNVPRGVFRYDCDANGNFTTELGGKRLTGSFVDSGSNGYFFPDIVGLSACPSSVAPGFYCPAADQGFAATAISASGDAQAAIAFDVHNAVDLLKTSNYAFSNLAGSMSDSFDWGLPFFLGRAIFVGIEGKASPLGNGTYWAF